MASKVVLVTDANCGVARRLVERILSECPQHSVILTAKTEASGAQTLREISAMGDYKSRMSFHTLNVLSAASIDALKSYVMETVGQLDVLVNNAAVDLDETDSVGETLKTHFFAAVELTEAMLPVVKMRGQIVVISSKAGLLSHVPTSELRQRLLSPSLTPLDVLSLAEEYTQSVASDTVERNGWPKSSYEMYRDLLNAYILAKDREQAGRTRINGLAPGWDSTVLGGPNAHLMLNEGIETPLKVVEGSDTGKIWSQYKLASWE